MNIRARLLVPLLLAARLAAPLAMAVAPTPDELSTAHQWAAARFQGRQEVPKPQSTLPNEPRAPLTTDAPFSFNYNDRSSAELLREWPLERASRESGPNQTEPKARYAVINLDAPTARQELTGGDLMDKGLPVDIPTQPGAALFTYRKVK
jgi:hypothetical protein